MLLFKRLVKLGTIFFTIFLLSACMPVIKHQGNQVYKPNIYKEQFVASDGSVLPVRIWQPKDGPVKAVIVALHGFDDYSNFFASPGKYLSSQGILCYAYDQRGFGGTSGRGFWFDIEAYTNDLSCFVKEIRNRHQGVPIYVLGESMGGAVTIVAMTGSNPPNVDGVILVAPAV